MTTGQMNTLIFKDQAGEYYVLPQAVLERGRVPGEMRAVIEERLPGLRAIGTAGDDVEGYVAPIVAGAAVGVASALLGIGIGVGITYGDDLGPLLRAAIAQNEG